MEKPTFVEKIEDQTKRNFSMNSVPVWAIKEFKQFCQQDCGDVYSVGLIQLLRYKEQWEQIAPLLSSIFNQLNQIKDAQQPKRRQELKTFAE